MQRFYKYEGMFFGFASGIVGWMSSDLFLQIVGGLATIAGCLASVAGFVQRLYELEKAKKDLELAELNKQLLEKQLQKEL